jgi:hypothetical protein
MSVVKMTVVKMSAMEAIANTALHRGTRRPNAGEEQCHHGEERQPNLSHGYLLYSFCPPVQAAASRAKPPALARQHIFGYKNLSARAISVVTML